MEEEEYASVEDLLASSLELESVSSTASRSTEILDPTPPEMAANETPAVQEQDEDDLLSSIDGDKQNFSWIFWCDHYFHCLLSSGKILSSF